MKTSRSAFFRNATALVLSPMKAVVMAAVCVVTVGCTSTNADHETGAPRTYSSTIDRPDGVANTPYNTGNPPSAIFPSTVNWRDVRQDVF
jgi:hypothetical protein